MQFIINHRPLKAIHPLEYELVIPRNSNCLFDLCHLGVLDVVGEQAASFLQGQLTTDLREVNVTQMRPAALCNLQGRVMALMDVVYKDKFQLIMPLDLLNTTKAALEKPALLSRVSIQINQQLKAFGCLIQNPQGALPYVDSPELKCHESMVRDNYVAYAQDAHLHIYLVDEDEKQRVFASFVGEQRGSLAWHAFALSKQIMNIYPSTRGLFLPHRLGLDKKAHLSFNKGCYKGQEIIARMHYRSKPKHEVKLVTIESREELQAGMKLFNALDKTEIGELIDYCPLRENHYLALISSLFEHDWKVLFQDHQETSMLSLMEDGDL